MLKSQIVVDLAPPQALPPASIPEACERAFRPLQNAPVPVRFVGEGFNARAVPRETWWRELAARVDHDVQSWAREQHVRATVRLLGENDFPSDGLAIEAHPLSGFLLYVLTWDAEKRGLSLRPVSHAAKVAAGVDA